MREAAGYGVDTSHIIWADTGRVGLYYYETGHGVRPADVMYDRKHTTICEVTPADIPAAWFQQVSARLFHTTGITLAISQQAAETARYLAEQAKANGWLISFDVNYRSKLWTPEEAARACDPLMQLADVIFLPYRDAVLLTGQDVGYESVPQALRRQYPNAVIVMTLGEDGALALAPDGTQHRHAAYNAPVLDRIGRGDAFDAGFLYGYLSAESNNVENGLRYGTAAAAYKQSIPGDLPLLNANALHRMVNEQPDTPFR
jgi:2-dehydro-3-deoxygluconokinase